MRFILTEAFKADGRPFTSYISKAVMLDGKRVGSVQNVKPSFGLFKERDDGRRIAWLGDGNQAGQHLGTFASLDAALEAIEKALKL